MLKFVFSSFKAEMEAGISENFCLFFFLASAHFGSYYLGNNHFGLVKSEEMHSRNTL